MAETKKDRYIGIDLGTTNTVMTTVYVSDDNEIRIVPEVFVDGGNRNELPSVVYFDNVKDKPIVGYAAKEKIEQMLYSKEKPFVTNAKTAIGTDDCLCEFKGKEYKAKDISMLLLERCGHTFNKNYKNQHNKYKYSDLSTVITIPARFSVTARRNTIDAAVEANFNEKEIRLLTEPIAALLSFIWDEKDLKEKSRSVDIEQPKNYMVVDLGGGTCDVVVVNAYISKENNKSALNFITKGTPGRVDLGGINFDELFADYLLDQFIKDNKNVKNNLTDVNKKQLKLKLIDSAEKFKKNIASSIDDYLNENDLEDEDYIESKVDTQQINKKIIEEINIPNFYTEFGNKIDFNKKISLEEYLNIIKKLMYATKTKAVTNKQKEEQDINIENVILSTLELDNLNLKDIDYVLFTGGMSNFLPIKKRIFEIVNRKILKNVNPMNAISNGAAIYALLIDEKMNKTYNNSDIPGINIEDNSPNLTIKIEELLDASYLIGLKDSLPDVLVNKNTKFPVELTTINRDFYTNSAKGVIIDIYRGQSEYDCHMEKLEPFICEFKNGYKNIGTKFNINYSIDKNGIIYLETIIGNEKFIWRGKNEK